MEAVAGRPSGTGRPTSPSDRERAHNFDQILAKREEHRSHVDERREARAERLRNQRIDERRKDRPTDDVDEAKQHDESKRVEQDDDQHDDPNAASDASTSAPASKSEPGTRANGKTRAPAPIAEELPQDGEASAKHATDADVPAMPSTAALKIQTAASLQRALGGATAPTETFQLGLPVSATGSASEVLTSVLHPEGEAASITARPDEARGHAAPETSTPDGANPPAVRFELATRADHARPTEAPRAEPQPTPADAHAADILRQLKLELAVGRREAQLTLEPAHLGRIAVKLALDHGRLRAEVRAESSDTLAVLQRHVPELRAMLEARGVTPESFDFQLGFQDRSRGGAQDGAPRRDAPSGASEPTTMLSRALREARSLVRGVWGIDTYA
ncbi:MAG: flagellar hook-length control protein FliK [Planctomycetes bacterium]|nr:flagellar hook-length control protein FliK [Planctomycetota bacterium]